jgi:hypothetical protein
LIWINGWAATRLQSAAGGVPGWRMGPGTASLGCRMNARAIGPSRLRRLQFETGHLVSRPRFAICHYRGRAIA